jgi:CelD/BcsL family acetyltransferase involved in cellulose biosynthesis
VFQGWAWTFCLATERFPHPVLLEATARGETVALALFNRRAGLHLGESGDPALDGVFIERNGILLARGHEALLQPCLRQIIAHARATGARPVVLSGVDARHLQAARATGARLEVRASRPAPFVDLAALRARGADYLDGRSANTRQQLRRALRLHAARGEVRIARAGDVAEAHLWLDRLAVLHQASWTGRGKPGAFAQPAFRRFHHALLDRAVPRGEAELLHITAGGETLGYLYGLRSGGRVCAYQSGFADPGEDARLKPGLVCHLLAIRMHAAEGADIYDFLGGEARYKRSLADASEDLHWLALAPRLSLPALLRTLKS